MIHVLVNNEHGFAISEGVLVDIVCQICLDHGVNRGEVSLAIIDDQTIHQLNREHLRHDYPTDVLSFLLQRDGDTLEGEVIVSADTATRVAVGCTWSAHDELLLYFIHGTLHLVGYDDKDNDGRRKMRDCEIHYLRIAGIQPPEGPGSRLPGDWQSKETSA